jgi:hypothetical protein
MSTTGTTLHGTSEAAGTSAPTRAATKPSRRRTPGGAGLGKDAGPEAQRLAAAVLEVLAGVRTPQQAAEALGMSLPRYFQVETRALQALVASCAPRPRGPGRNLERQLTALQRQHEQLQRQLSRQQTLVRLAQRHLGLAPPQAVAKPPGGKDNKGKKRRRKPVVRALRAAEVLQRRRQESPSPEAAPAEAAAAAGPPPKDVDS